jgi:hypothetical protein
MKRQKLYDVYVPKISSGPYETAVTKERVEELRKIHGNVMFKELKLLKTESEKVSGSKLLLG